MKSNTLYCRMIRSRYTLAKYFIPKYIDGAINRILILLFGEYREISSSVFTSIHIVRIDGNEYPITVRRDTKYMGRSRGWQRKYITHTNITPKNDIVKPSGYGVGSWMGYDLPAFEGILGIVDAIDKFTAYVKKA